MDPQITQITQITLKGFYIAGGMNADCAVTQRLRFAARLVNPKRNLRNLSNSDLNLSVSSVSLW